MKNNSYFDPEIIGSGTAITNCKINAAKIALSDAPVLITGESGTGKELFADYIYYRSPRKGKPFVKINCAAIPETLIESELFGHVKGAFTDAGSDRKGKFITAHTGTIFLDEIGELPLNTQSTILRTIENGNISQVGSDRLSSSDVRIISATNRNIEKQVKEGKVRKDFFYRINVLSLEVPPLRDRKEDIPEIINYFIKQSDRNINIDRSGIKKLSSYDWPGNVRELENFIKRLVVTFEKTIVTEDDIKLPGSSSEKNNFSTLKDAVFTYKKNYIMSVLASNNWNKSRTSSVLGIQRTYLSRLIKELDIKEKKGAQ